MSTLRKKDWRSRNRVRQRSKWLKQKAHRAKKIRIEIPDVTIEGGGNFKIDYYLDYIRELLVIEALIASDWSMTDAAKMIGLSQQQVQRRMVKYGIAADTAHARLDTLRGDNFMPFLMMTAESREGGSPARA